MWIGHAIAPPPSNGGSLKITPEFKFRTCHAHPDVEVPELDADNHAGIG